MTSSARLRRCWATGLSARPNVGNPGAVVSSGAVQRVINIVSPDWGLSAVRAAAPVLTGATFTSYADITLAAQELGYQPRAFLTKAWRMATANRRTVNHQLLQRTRHVPQQAFGVIPARGLVSVPGRTSRRWPENPYRLPWPRQRVPELDLLVVSTDAPEIAAVAKAYGVMTVNRPRILRLQPRPLNGPCPRTRGLGPGGSFDYVVVFEPTRRSAARYVRSCIHDC